MTLEGRAAPTRSDVARIARRSARRLGDTLADGRWLSLVALLTYFAIWFILTREGLGLIRPIKFPSPAMVVEAAGRLQSVLAGDIVATMRRVGMGFVGGVLLGVGTGLVMSYSRRVYYFLNPLIEGMRPVPAIAMIPFFVMWFGLAESGKLILTVMGVFAIMVVSTLEAVKNVPPIYVNAARTLGASDGLIFRRIVLPKIVPELIGPLRVALALSFTLVVAAEFIGAESGLGYRLIRARLLFETDVLFLGVVIFGVLAAICDTILRRSLGYVTRWSPRSEGRQ